MRERTGILDGIEKSINELYLKTSRPSYGGDCDGEISECKSAIEMCRTKHALDVPKVETTEWTPTPHTLTKPSPRAEP